MVKFGDVWAEISLNNLTDNVAVIRQHISPQSKIMAVIKADAYGHGAGEVAERLVREEIDYFGVASVAEGIELVDCGIEQPVLVLRSVLPEQLSQLLDHGLIPTINCMELAKAAEIYGERQRKRIKIHIRVDTGSEGDGIPSGQCPGFLKELRRMEWLDAEGIYTHLVSAYGDDLENLKEQLARFNSVLDAAREMNWVIPLIHAASSPGIFEFPASHFNMVRVGTALYGLPFGRNKRNDSLKPVMQLKSRVVCIKEFQEGYSLGYGVKYPIEKPIRIATVAIGYADAPFLLKTGDLPVLIDGEKVTIYGKPHMDHIKVDITGHDHITVGDEVVIFGDSGDQTLEAAAVVKAGGYDMVNCESVCFLGKRVNRVYIEDGRVVKVRRA